MKETEEKAAALLKAHGMDPHAVDLASVLSEFLSEMEAGLSGSDSSLAMIPTFISPEGDIPEGELVTVVDAGGTNLRVCSVAFDGGANIDYFENHPMPGVGTTISADEFYDTICGCLAPVADRSDRIGFCFSYPVEITPERDGKLLHWTKEIQVPEVVGTTVGEGLKSALSARGYERKQIVLLNDTVATLLAGRAADMAGQSDGYVGLILGTGTNTAYVEKNSAIAKRSDLDSDKSQVINVESGNFSKAPRGRIDIEFGNTTVLPDAHLFEKMISGAYVGPLSLTVLKAAAGEGLFQGRAAEQIGRIESIVTRQMDDILWDRPLDGGPFGGDAFSGEDLELMRALFSRLVDRAARLTAVSIAAVVVKTDTGRGTGGNVSVTVDGSMFHNTYNFRMLVEQHLDEILAPRGRCCEIKHVENAPIIGAAIAGLTG